MKKRKAICGLLAVILLIATGAFAFKGYSEYKHAEIKDMIDYKTAYNLGDNEDTVTFNNELMDYRAIDVDGSAYLELSGVSSTLNSRFYYDETESKLLYTLPEGNAVTAIDWDYYTTADGNENKVGYKTLVTANDKIYIAVEYIKLFTKCNIDVYTDPNRVVVRNDFSEQTMVTAHEDTYIRVLGGPKSEVLRQVSQGENFYLLDDTYDDWVKVASEDGYVGWISKKTTGDSFAAAPTAPEFVDFVYATTQRDHKIKMVWHQVMYESANDNFESAFANVTGINVVAPTWFAFNDTEGNIRSIASYDYVANAHARGMEVWALFSNEFPGDDGELQGFAGMGVPTDAVLSSTTKRENAISQIISYCLDYGIDGINMDFENIIAPSEDGTGKSAANFIQFVREMSVACHKNGLILSVDNYVPMYTQHYNRSEEGAFADYLVIMGYDEYNSGSVQAGPNASLGFVEQGINDTLNAGVDASKIINGIPFYTRYWYTDGETLKCAEASMGEALQYAESHDVVPQWDDSMGLNYVTYEGSDGCTYQMWLEDTDAVARKMQLITSYDLGGVSCWKLGQEVTEVWSVINEYMP